MNEIPPVFQSMRDLHQQVRELVEKECACRVTAITGTSTTEYAPPVPVPLVGEGPEYILTQILLSFRVRGMIDVVTTLECEVYVESTGAMRIANTRLSNLWPFLNDWRRP